MAATAMGATAVAAAATAAAITTAAGQISGRTRTRLCSPRRSRSLRSCSKSRASAARRSYRPVRRISTLSRARWRRSSRRVRGQVSRDGSCDSVFGPRGRFQSPLSFYVHSRSAYSGLSRPASSKDLVLLFCCSSIDLYLPSSVSAPIYAHKPIDTVLLYLYSRPLEPSHPRAPVCIQILASRLRCSPHRIPLYAP